MRAKEVNNFRHNPKYHFIHLSNSQFALIQSFEDTKPSFGIAISNFRWVFFILSSKQPMKLKCKLKFNGSRYARNQNAKQTSTLSHFFSIRIYAVNKPTNSISIKHFIMTLDITPLVKDIKLIILLLLYFKLKICQVHS